MGGQVRGAGRRGTDEGAWGFSRGGGVNASAGGLAGCVLADEDLMTRARCTEGMMTRGLGGQGTRGVYGVPLPL